LFQAEDGIRDFHVTGVQTCALPISRSASTPGTLPGLATIPWPSALSTWTAFPPCISRTLAMRSGARVWQRTGAITNSPKLACSRSEERRVGKEGRVREGADEEEEGE